MMYHADGASLIQLVDELRLSITFLACQLANSSIACMCQNKWRQ